MRDIADRLVERQRKCWLRSRPLFRPYAHASGPEIAKIGEKVGAPLPASLAAWLAAVGFGDIDEDLSFRTEWFSVVEHGELKGAVIFAQDTLGNFYGYHPVDERIVFFSRSEPGHAVLARSFREFLEELERRDWKIMDWVESIPLRPYEWANLTCQSTRTQTCRRRLRRRWLWSGHFHVKSHHSSMGYLLSMHLTRKAPDRARLRAALPQSLGFEVYWNESLRLYGIDTFRASKPNKWPFTYATPATDLPLEMGPHLSDVRRAYEALRAAGPCNGFKRSYVNLVELVSQALFQPVLTVYADDDEADFACLAEEGRAISIVARCDDMVLRFEKGSSNVQPAADDRVLHANAAEMVRVFSGEDPIKIGMSSWDPPENYGFVHVPT